jgi:hypothetical protein
LTAIVEGTPEEIAPHLLVGADSSGMPEAIAPPYTWAVIWSASANRLHVMLGWDDGVLFQRVQHIDRKRCLNQKCLLHLALTEKFSAEQQPKAASTVTDATHNGAKGAQW